MSKESKISLELINRGGKRKNLSFDLKKDDDIKKLLEYVVEGDVESPMDLYVADLVIDGKNKGAENIGPIAQAFLYFSTLKNGIECIKKLRKNILDWENNSNYVPVYFSAKLNKELRKILKQNGIDSDDLDITKDTPEEIFKILSKIENKKIDSVLEETSGKLNKTENRNVIDGDNKIKVYFNLSADDSKCSTEELNLNNPEDREKLLKLIGKAQKNNGFIIDGKDKDYNEKNAESIAMAFLYSTTMKEEEGKEYIKKLKATIFANHGIGEGKIFLKLVDSKIKEILEQKGIKDVDLDIAGSYPKEIFKKLSKVKERTQDLKNKDIDLEKVRKFLLDGDFEKGFKEFKKDSKINKLNNARAIKKYFEELEKNENLKFPKEEIKIIENFNPIFTSKGSDFVSKYSDLLKEQTKKDLGPQEYGKVYSLEGEDESVGDGYMQTLGSRTDSNQISYSEFVEIESYKNAISSIFDRAIKEGITLEESAKKVKEELKIENDKNEKFEKGIESKSKENEALSNEEKEYLNKQKDFLKKRNKKIEEYVKNYGLEEEMTDQKADSEE